MASIGWTPLARIAEKGVLDLMQKITVGHLQVFTPSHIYDFPEQRDGMSSDGPFAKLRVVKDSFWIRLALMSDLGFAEAFMYGDVECDDLVALFKIFLLNREELAAMQSSPISMLFNMSQRLTSIRFLNTLSDSRSNVSAHYDISNQMFQAFLSPDMSYSCAIFPTLDEDVITEYKHHRLREKEHFTPSSGNEPGNVDSTVLDSSKSSPDPEVPDELYEAQMHTMRYLIEKLKIPEHSEKTIRVLEIGSGWGALAILLTQTYPFIEVDSITLSSEQKSLADERICAAGVKARARIWLMDYRSIPESWSGTFDRVISIEMVEAVGLEFLPTYWGVVERCMKPSEAVGVVQSSTMPEPRYANYIQGIDFIRKWVSSLYPAFFPGGHAPTATSLLDGLLKGGKSKLVVDNVENIGPHYARTLREWRRRFLTKFESAIIPALQREYPDVFDDTTQGRDEIEIFKRKWVYY
ncbi:cyclopropane-fatty-acyl-phospholipid synthase [Ceratobasidium sp. AG-Ba]|nr:cyclopropane-fatty-acyl-phospholipid synthase [Ceratobasidium sp. AG-Ba]